MSVPFDKIKQLDKYAKSLGITLYDIKYGYENNTQIIHCLNLSPERENEPNPPMDLAQFL